MNFFDNNMTSPEILGMAIYFETLEIFYIGKNDLDLNLLHDKNKKYSFPPNLKELGIGNNFNQYTNIFISKNLELENIKSLFVNGDRFTSLKIFENIKFKQLEELWVRGDKDKGYLTDIKDINYIQGKETIKKIVLKQNRINNIEELVNIISSFPNLNLLNLEDNKIDKKKIEKIINQIKLKGFEKLKIKY